MPNFVFFSKKKGHMVTDPELLHDIEDDPTCSVFYYSYDAKIFPEQRAGYGEEYTKYIFNMLQHNGISLAGRFKSLGIINITQYFAAPKRIEHEGKTAPTDSLYKGILRAKEQSVEGAKPIKVNDGTKPIYQDKSNQHIFYTFGTISLEDLLAKLATGECQLLEGDKPSTTVFDFVDAKGDKYQLDLSNLVEAPKMAKDRMTPVSKRKGLLARAFSSPALQSPLEEAISRKTPENPEGIDVSRGVLLKKYDSPDSKTPSELPYIVCEKDGTPIRGDVDLQFVIFSQQLPVYAFRMLALDLSENARQEAIKAIVELLNNIPTSDPLYQTIDKGLNYLRDNPEILTDDRVQKAGRIDVISLAIMYYSQSIEAKENEHGCEAFSLYAPENILTTLIPYKEGYLETHSEYELLRTLHIESDMLAGNVIMFNPCFFVPGNWRKNVSEKDVRDKAHALKCNNLDDEPTNIILWRLLFKKVLLDYKLRNPEKFEDFVNVIIGNFDLMIQYTEDARKKAELAGDDEKQKKLSSLGKMQTDGKKMAESIVTECRALTSSIAIETAVREIATSACNKDKEAILATKAVSIDNIGVNRNVNASDLNIA